MKHNFMFRAFQTIIGFIILPIYASNLSGIATLFFYSVARLLALPIYYLNFDSYEKFLLYIHRRLPELKIKTNHGYFLCRRGSPDISYAMPMYEKETAQFLESVNIRDGVIVDIGANIGRYSIMLGRKFKNVKILAIEPESSNFEALKKNIQLNVLKNVTPLKFAISEKDSKMMFFIHEDAGCHSLVIRSPRKVEVKVRTLDSIIEELKIDPKDITLIKIDAEGVTGKVFLGSKKILKQSEAKIVFEALDKSELEMSAKILSNFGYKVDAAGIDKLNFFAHK